MGIVRRNNYLCCVQLVYRTVQETLALSDNEKKESQQQASNPPFFIASILNSTDSRPSRKEKRQKLGACVRFRERGEHHHGLTTPFF